MNRFLYMQSFKRQRMTVSLPADLVERVRDAAYWTPGRTMAGLIATALEDLLRHLELENGRPFPPRLGALKSGRPRANRGPKHAVSEQIHGVSSRIPA